MLSSTRRPHDRERDHLLESFRISSILILSCVLQRSLLCGFVRIHKELDNGWLLDSGKIAEATLARELVNLSWRYSLSDFISSLIRKDWKEDLGKELFVYQISKKRDGYEKEKRELHYVTGTC